MADLGSQSALPYRRIFCWDSSRDSSERFFQEILLWHFAQRGEDSGADRTTLEMLLPCCQMSKCQNAKMPKCYLHLKSAASAAAASVAIFDEIVIRWRKGFSPSPLQDPLRDLLWLFIFTICGIGGALGVVTWPGHVTQGHVMLSAGLWESAVSPLEPWIHLNWITLQYYILPDEPSILKNAI